MNGLHSRTKEQREAVSLLVRSVIVQDMGTFNPERFANWVRNLDFRFGKVGLTLEFTISPTRSVQFRVKDIRTKRTIYNFAASTRVRFEEDQIVIVTSI